MQPDALAANEPMGNRDMAMAAFAERANRGGGQVPGGAPPGQTLQRRTPVPGGQPPTMSDGGIKQLQQSAPDEAIIIVKALIQRLRELTRAEFGEKEPVPQVQ